MISEKTVRVLYLIKMDSLASISIDLKWWRRHHPASKFNQQEVFHVFLLSTVFFPLHRMTCLSSMLLQAFTELYRLKRFHAALRTTVWSWNLLTIWHFLQPGNKHMKCESGSSEKIRLIPGLETQRPLWTTGRCLICCALKDTKKTLWVLAEVEYYCHSNKKL